MRTDFSLFRERLAEACRAKDMTEFKLYRSVGLAPKRGLDLALTGLVPLDVYRLCQIADVLDVSLDWLTGRSNVMDVMEMPEPPKRRTKKG